MKNNFRFQKTKIIFSSDFFVILKTHIEVTSWKAKKYCYSYEANEDDRIVSSLNVMFL